MDEETQLPILYLNLSGRLWGATKDCWVPSIKGELPLRRRKHYWNALASGGCFSLNLVSLKHWTTPLPMS